MSSTGRMRAKCLIALTSVGFLGLSGCAAQYANHGYIPPADELEQITVGTDTRESVAEKVGVPASSSVRVYVRARTRTLGLLATKEIERQVVAISFTENGVVENVERFGMERGQVVPLERRVTSSSVSDKSFIRQLLGNIGRFSPTAFGS